MTKKQDKASKEVAMLPREQVAHANIRYGPIWTLSPNLSILIVELNFDKIMAFWRFQVHSKIQENAGLGGMCQDI